MTNPVVGVTALKTVVVAKYGQIKEGVKYFFSPELADELLARGIVEIFKPKEKKVEPQKEEKTVSKKKG